MDMSCKSKIQFQIFELPNSYESILYPLETVYSMRPMAFAGFQFPTQFNLSSLEFFFPTRAFNPKVNFALQKS